MAPAMDRVEAEARELALGACFCALGVVIPALFHAVNLGAVFLPMHLPVLIGGLLLRPRTAALVGVVTPWVSSFVTGMPPVPFAVVMCLELAALGGVASLLTSAKVPAWLATPLAICARCVVTCLVTGWLGGAIGLPARAAGAASLLSGAPGVVLQLIVAPGIAMAIRSRRLRSACQDKSQ